METFVLFRGSRRLTLRDEDMTTAKISRIFQVTPDSMFLSDDRNTAIFPDENGHFSDYLLRDSGHYEVNGDTYGSLSCPSRQPFESREVPAGGQPSRRATPPSGTQNKTFSRRVQLVESHGSALLPVQTVYLRLSEQEANVGSISEKIENELDAQESVIVLNSRGQEIQDGPGTQGQDFWKIPTRKVLCMTASAHKEFLSDKCQRNKHRRRDVSDALNEHNNMMDVLLEKSKTIENRLSAIAKATSDDILVKFTRREEKAIKDAFACCICKGPMRKPMFAACCKSLLACQNCLARWYLVSSHCPKCRAETGEEDSMVASGLEEALKAIGNIISEV